MERAECTESSPSIELEMMVSDVRGLQSPGRSSEKSPGRPRIIYRTPTNSICVPSNEEYDGDQTHETSPILAIRPTFSDSDYIPAATDAIELDVIAHLRTDRCSPANASVCSADRGNNEAKRINNHHDDTDAGSKSDCGDCVSNDDVDKRYLALYCNNFCHTFSDGSKCPKSGKKKKTGSGVMDTCQCCCLSSENSLCSIAKYPSHTEQALMSTSFQKPSEYDGSSINKQQTTNFTRVTKPTPTRISSPIGILWTLLSIMVAGTCSFSFLQPFWLIDPQTWNSFGMYSYCIRGAGFFDRPRQTCGIYGGRFMFSNVPSRGWQAACVLYGGGCALHCVAAVLAICSMCVPRVCNHRLAVTSGYIQIMAGNKVYSHSTAKMDTS